MQCPAETSTKTTQAHGHRETLTTPQLLYNCFLYQMKAAKDGTLTRANQQIAERLKKEGVPLLWFVDFTLNPYKPYVIPSVPYAPPPTKKP